MEWPLSAGYSMHMIAMVMGSGSSIRAHLALDLFKDAELSHRSSNWCAALLLSTLVA